MDGARQKPPWNLQAKARAWVSGVAFCALAGTTGVSAAQDACVKREETIRWVQACEALTTDGRPCEALAACTRAEQGCPGAWAQVAAPRRRALRACRESCDENGPQCRAEGFTCQRGRCARSPRAAELLLQRLLTLGAPTAGAPCDARDELQRLRRLAWDAGLEHRLPMIIPRLNDAAEACSRLWAGEAGSAWVGRDGAPMVLVPAGPFLRGSDEEGIGAGLEVCRATYASPGDCNPGWFARESPRRTIDLDAFYIDTFEVTNARYQRCVQANHCSEIQYTECQLYDARRGAWSRGGEPGDYVKASDHPAVCVTWEQAQAYCQWAGKRLPTEAEWEKAARGTDGRQFPWGAAWNGAWLNWGERDGYGREDNFTTTAPVGAFPQNRSPFGAMDMAGNVWEWTLDWHSEDFYARAPERNPRNLTSSSFKVLRGGSWRFAGNSARSAYRYFDRPSAREDTIGFRCALGPP